MRKRGRPKGKCSPNISQKQMDKICVYMSEMHTYKEVMEFIKNDLGKEVSFSWIWNMFNKEGSKWMKKVELLRNKYLANIDNVPGSHKKVRLARYDTLFEKALEYGKVASAKAILDSMREEVEGKEKHITIGNAVIAQINKMPDEELVKEKDRILEKLEKLKRVIPMEQKGGKDAS